MKPKFKAGKFYRTSNGNKAEIYKMFYNESNSIYKMHGAVNSRITAWKSNGDVISTYRQSDVDDSIITEWAEKPVVNWSVMPAWAQWVAQDEDQNWFWYLEKPTLDIELGMFYIENDKADEYFGSFTGQIYKTCLPTFNGNWKDSLVQRS